MDAVQLLWSQFSRELQIFVCFFSGLARGCRPPRSDHINEDISIIFQPISIKFKFYQFPTPNLKKSPAMLDSKTFQSCFGPKSERCMIQLLCELITLAIQLKLNKFKNDFILSIIYGVIPVLFFLITSISSLARTYV